MADRGYSWKNVRQGSSFSLPKTEHVGRLVVVAVVLALLAHGLLFVGLKQMQVSLPALREMFEVETEPIVVREVEFRESLPEVQTEELAEPPKLAGKLLDEIEILEEIPEDMELDMSPEIADPQFDVEMMTPAMKGAELADTFEPIKGPDFADDLPEIGRTEDILQIAAAGQIVIDPGEQKVDEFDPDKFNEELERKGAGGLADKGSLDSFTPLSAMTRMEGNALENAKGMIGSDLLFEFNQARLRESARNSLLKVALLIDKNPNLNCWIEGHTDTIGGDQANGELSLQRAKAVKTWLVESMRISPERLIVIGYGKRQPIIKVGDQNVQAMNRRVVIKMRRNKPDPSGDMFLENGDSPKAPATVVEEEAVTLETPITPEKPSIPKPEVEPDPAPVAEIEEEQPVLVKPSGPPVIPVAEPVEEEPGRAVEVQEEPAEIERVAPGRAVPVEE